jgi:Bacterial protein of unknown function (DUF899)
VNHLAFLHMCVSQVRPFESVAVEEDVAAPEPKKTRRGCRNVHGPFVLGPSKGEVARAAQRAADDARHSLAAKRRLTKVVKAEEPSMLPHKVVSRDEWLTARKAHLRNEKALTRMRDMVAAERRTLPWVKVEKRYVFDTPDGERTLAELFDGRSQLIVYHFMKIGRRPIAATKPEPPETQVRRMG